MDFTDIGFSLTNYQQIFNDPQSVNYGFDAWLTNVIGGVWITLFGDSLGLLGANLAGIIAIYLTIGFTYLTLKTYIDRTQLLIGLLLVSIFPKYFLFVLNYDSLTFLFFSASAFFLINGLKFAKNWQILASGLILGLNIFNRFPNILGFSLILGIFFYGYINKNTTILQIKQVICFISGYVLAILIAIFTMKILGHYEIFTNSISALMNMASDRTGHHGIINLLLKYINNYLQIIAYPCIVILFAIAVTKFFSLFKRWYLYYGFMIIISIMLIIIASLGLFHIYNRISLMIAGFLYMILLGYIINVEKSSHDFRLISFVALLILIITPLGSGNGLNNAVYGMWIPIPIAFAYIFRLKKMSVEIETENDLSATQWKISLNYKETKLSVNFFVTLFVVISLVMSFACTYRDSSNRIEIHYSVKHPRLMGIFTIQERAKVAQELLSEVGKYVKEDDYLLAYNDIPMVHFLTKTKPYLYNSWIELYQPNELRQALERAMKENPHLPVVIKAKSSAANSNWPKTNVSFSLSERKIEDIAIIDDFIKYNKYSIVWENDFFEILIPLSK